MSSALLEDASQDARSDPRTPQQVAAPESLSTAITRAFMESRPVSSRRSPLRERQAAAERNESVNLEVNNDTLKSIESTAIPHAQTRNSTDRASHPRRQVLRQRTSEDFFDTGPSSDDVGEPDLPPTPTQLGISPHPDKPRGLALSSSPSGRRARRAAKEAAEGHIMRSSPLKAHENEESPTGNNSDEALESGAVEAAGIVAEQDSAMANGPDDQDENMREKLGVKRYLTSQLLRLQAELKQIESMVGLTDIESEELDLDDNIIGLLTTDNPSCLPPFAATNAKMESSPAPPDLISPSDDTALQYLNLFAPGNLQLTTTSSTTFTPDHSKNILQTHKLLLTPPSPFPAHIFSLELLVETNITKQVVNNIVLQSSSKLKGHDGLRSWILSRLETLEDGTPCLHSRDVGTIVWGAGMWWDAILKRAKIWSTLEKNNQGLKNKTGDFDEDDSNKINNDPTSITSIQLKSLLPNLRKESMTFSFPPSTQNSLKIESKPTKAIHLTYTLNLDWTGDPTPNIEICSIGLGGPLDPPNTKHNDATHVATTIKKESEPTINGEMNLKQVFEKLRRKSGIIEAVRGVKSLVFGKEAQEGYQGVGSEGLEDSF
ncbi:hypothetical protein UCRPC4_g06797 [Phaeomoniella chlamydospora]|uniref:Uncharacterized protein n=1 Tax=Phaeomoniella chlamydospora TaxID=158046 RepID=A0A0G2DTU6_PHACM|nr:hypothetical protein UCRPC4_g06797 [Phaeomoniella chlamydospora]